MNYITWTNKDLEKKKKRLLIASFSDWSYLHYLHPIHRLNLHVHRSRGWTG